MDLNELGWNAYFNDNFTALNNKDLFPARVATSQRGIYSVLAESGEYRAEISGKFRFNTLSKSDLPVVGDWVAARLSPEGSLAVIESTLPRMSKLSRKAAGDTTEEQLLVANIDTIFLINGLDGDYNLRRIERYLALAGSGNVKPVILLNKSDTCANVQERMEEVRGIAPSYPIHVLSALNNTGMEYLTEYIKKGSTIAFLGSSGAGKSTIINLLLGEERLKVGSVRESDSRGNHTTTHRELMLLPDGGIVIDNPGLRELQLWGSEEGLENSFDDVNIIAAECRFNDCKHADEPGCAVRAAIEKGALDPKRFQNYIKMKKELAYLAARKQKVKTLNEIIVKEKNIAKLSKQIQKHKKNYEY